MSSLHRSVIECLLASATTRANSVDSTLQSTPALTASKEPEPELSRWCSHRRGSYKSSSLRCWCLHAASVAPMALTYRMRRALAMATWQDFRDILPNKHTGCHGHVLTKASLIACNVLPCPPLHGVQISPWQIAGCLGWVISPHSCPANSGPKPSRHLHFHEALVE